MTEQLKPCPFCGSEAELRFSEGESGKRYYWIPCKKCSCCQTIFDTPQEAVSAWNNRPIEDLKDDENTRLEKNLKDYNRVMLENARLREALQMIATEKDNHGQWLSVEQAAQIAKDTLDGGLI